ncbi:MAG: hypothetical protein ACH37Z_18105 [Anaerolineae bacterium]
MSKSRLDLDSLEDAELLRRGIGAARAGETDAARSLLEELTRRDPLVADGWLWLASVESDPHLKRVHFQRVLDLRPQDEEAQAGLELLVEKYGRGILADASGDPVARACTWHSDRETLISCSRCGRPMCPACSRKHPVGLRCKECARELRSPLYKVSTAQVMGGLAAGTGTAFGAAMVLGFVAAAFCWIGIFLAWGAGFLIGDATSWGAGRKRGRKLQWVAAVATVLGVALLELLVRRFGLLTMFPAASLPRFVETGPLLVLFLGAAAAVQRLK